MTIIGQVSTWTTTNFHYRTQRWHQKLQVCVAGKKATQLRLHIADNNVDTWKGPSSCRNVRPCAAHKAILVLAFQSIEGPSALPNKSRSKLPWKSLSKTNILCSEPSRAWKPISLQSEECCKEARVFTSLTNSFRPWKSRKDGEIGF